jgi:hypothetical protein
MKPINDQIVKFQLSDGSIEFTNEKLIILDNAKRDRLLLLFTTISTLILSLSLLFKWTQTNDRYYMVIGVILLIPNIGLLYKWFKEFTYIENQIQYTDIDYFKLVNIKLGATKVLLIRTRTKKFRRIKIYSNNLDLFIKYIEGMNMKFIC